MPFSSNYNETKNSKKRNRQKKFFWLTCIRNWARLDCERLLGIVGTQKEFAIFNKKEVLLT